MKNLKAIFVFLGSPGELGEERRIFLEVIDRVNKDSAIEQDMIYIPIIYEDIESTSGIRNQTVINNRLGKCDFVLCMFWKTLGHPSTDPQYESNTVEEYYKARELLDQKKVYGVALMFKDIPECLLDDQGDQVKKLIDFKKKVKQQDSCIYKSFNESDFKDKIRTQLDKWLTVARDITVATPMPFSAKGGADPENQIISDIIAS